MCGRKVLNSSARSERRAAGLSHLSALLGRRTQPGVDVAGAAERADPVEQARAARRVEPAVAGEAHRLDGRVVVAVVAEPALDAVQRGEGGVVRRRQVLERQRAQRPGQPGAAPRPRSPRRRSCRRPARRAVRSASSRVSTSTSTVRSQRTRAKLRSAATDLDPVGRHRRDRRRRGGDAEPRRAPAAPRRPPARSSPAGRGRRAAAGRAGSPAAARPRPPARPAAARPAPGCRRGRRCRSRGRPGRGTRRRTAPSGGAGRGCRGTSPGTGRSPRRGAACPTVPRGAMGARGERHVIQAGALARNT